MSAEDGKAPAPRPLARWALATLLADAVLAIALYRLPRPTLLDMAPSEPLRGRVVGAYAIAERAVFVRTEGIASASVTLVVVARGARSTARSEPYDLLARLSVSPCRTLEELAVVRPGQCAARDEPAIAPSTGGGLAWSALEGGRWVSKRCAIDREVGSASIGERSVTARCDRVEVGSLRGFRVENPWVSVDKKRTSVDRDVRVERAMIVRDQAGRALFLATADGVRLDFDGAQPKRGLLATLAGRLGADGLAAVAAAWMLAQVIAVVAARSDSASSAFWRRFLRWSAMLSVFVTGAMAVAALRASQ